jgi:phage FluMu protein Com
MITRTREIRIYRCKDCGTVIHDHGEIGCRFSEMECPRCKRTMGHSTETYEISHPDPENLRVRMARKVTV